MNILYVSDSLTVSGAEIVLLQHLDWFRRPEFETRVFLRRGNHRLIEQLDLRRIPWTATEAFSRVLLETTADPRRLSHFARSFFRVAHELRREMRSHHADLVVSVSYPASLYAAAPALWCRVPQVWHEHNIKRIHRVNRWLYRFTARSCSAVVGPSKAVTGNLSRAGIPPSKLRTVYNGIDPSRFDIDPAAADRVRAELGLVPGRPAVGFVGQLLPHKGHRTLIEAAPTVRDQVPDACFVMVGAMENPPYERELRLLIASLGLSHAFRFCGWRNDLPAVYRALDVLAVPTLTPEPFGLVTVEAMAAGTPVVASAAGGSVEIVGDRESGLLFPPGDSAALAGAIVTLLKNRGLHDAIGAAGKQRVRRKFTLQRHYQEFERVYRDACPLSAVPAPERADS